MFFGGKMKKVFNGVHFYVNINNLNTIIKSDENNHDNLGRTFHALNTFIATMEKFANEFDDVEVEKFTTSRLHFYIPIQDNSDTVINEMLELISFAQTLANFINKNSKYQSLVNFKIGAGADYGKYTEFPFEDNDSGFKEMTTIGSPANRAAKLQSLCDNGKVLISKEVYQMLPKSMHGVFFGNHEATIELVKKYADLSAYEAEIADVSEHLDESYDDREGRGLDYASTVANNLNLKDIKISDVKSKLSFDGLSVRNMKDVEKTAMLFADIRGFTKKVDENNLAEMKQLTQTVLTMMNKAVRDRDGVHVQFQGDRESAVFNYYGDENDDYALRAILSAMRMLDGIDKINESREDKLKIGIGCSLGEIYATRIGMKKTEKKFNVTMGQTVKEADDAEDNVAGVGIESKASEIAITSDMYNYLVALDGNKGKFFKETFTPRIVKRKTYYVSTTRFSEYQKKAITYSREQNASRASNNQGIKPWGFKG